MPTYEYQCHTCETRFDVVQSFSDSALSVCPEASDIYSPLACSAPGEGQVKKVFSVPAITFKGDGFYKTDSRKTAGVGAGKEKSGRDSKSGSDTKEGSDSSSGSKSDTESATSKSAGKSSGNSSDSKAAKKEKAA